MQAIWSAPARKDVLKIVEYYSVIDAELARRIVSAISEAPRKLVQRPYLGAPAGIGELRKWSVAKTPYLLLYRVDKDHIGIARVHHEAENWRAG